MSDDLAPMGEDTTAADETQAESTEATQPSHEDRIQERLAEITGRLPDLVNEAVQQSMSQWQQQNTPDDDTDDEWDLEPGDDGYDDQQLQRFLEEQIAAGVEKQLAPMQQERMLEKRNDAYHTLTQALPELQDPQVAAEYVQAAHDLVEGNEAFVNSPRFVDLIEKVYKAAKADERAQQQTAADGRTTTLESQGGAAPRDEEESLDDRLARKAQSANTF